MPSRLVVVSGATNPFLYECTPVFRKVTGITMLSAALPNSQYVIHPGNNSASLDGSAVTIPVGNFTLNEILERLTQGFRSVSNNQTFECKQNNDGKVTITSDPNQNPSFDIKFPGSTLYRILGFVNGGTNTAVNGVLTAISKGIAYDTQLYQIYLCSSVFDQRQLSLGTVLTRRDDAVTFYQASPAEAKQRPSQFSPLPLLSSFTVKVTDEFGRNVDFNGVSIAIELRISVCA